jgi:hypothetical protein
LVESGLPWKIMRFGCAVFEDMRVYNGGTSTG